MGGEGREGRGKGGEREGREGRGRGKEGEREGEGRGKREGRGEGRKGRGEKRGEGRKGKEGEGKDMMITMMCIQVSHTKIICELVRHHRACGHTLIFYCYGYYQPQNNFNN